MEFFALLDDFGDAGDGAAGADAGDEDVDLALGVAPDFLGGGGAVDGGVGGVVELLGHEAASAPCSARIWLARSMAPRMPPGPGRQDDFRAQHAQEHAALHGHGLGHGQNDLVALGGGDEGEGDAGVAGGRLDDDHAGLEAAVFFAGFDHRACRCGP